MKIRRYFLNLRQLSSVFTRVLSLIVFAGFLFSCEEETSEIGSSLASGEVSIRIDTLEFNLKAKPVKITEFDSKTGNLLLGNIEKEEYGALSCSFVTRLMCAPNLPVPDSLFSVERVDSCKLVFFVQRDEIVGDSLAPQKLSVFGLTKQLPSDITNTFNPESPELYYDPSQPLATKSFTVSNVAGKDSVFYKQNYVEISIDLGKDFGKKIFEQYINNPSIFQWPQTMAKEFLPGLYVKQTFGTGCLANIFDSYVAVYYYNLKEVTSVVDDENVTTLQHVTNIVYPFSISPEVLSSNIINYEPSALIRDMNDEDDGRVVITTPGGYIASFDFPVDEILREYTQNNIYLSRVNDLILYIPSEDLKEDPEFNPCQNILLVKASEYESFFKDNKIPDNKSSFTGVYDSVNKRYIFGSLRQYILNIIEKGTVEPEDVEFLLVPVELTTETVSNGYYGSSTTSYVTKCVPYTVKPTISVLRTDKASAQFSFSSQMIL